MLMRKKSSIFVMINTSKMKKKENKILYNLQITPNQLSVLTKACESYARLICGQSMELRDLMEDAWEKHCMNATGTRFDEEWNGGWSNAREEAESISRNMRQKFWFCAPGSQYGMGYDQSADILFDLYHVLRYQHYCDMSEEDKEKCRWTVLADTPVQLSKEPLAKINKIKNK